MLLDVKNEVFVIEVLATNIAWMYSFKMVELEEIKASLCDLILTNHVQEELVNKVYRKYIDIINSGNNLS